MLGGVDRADQDISARSADKGVYVGRIERDGALEIAASALDVVGAALAEPLNSLEIEVDGIRIGHGLRPLRFCGKQLRTQLIGELGDNFILHVEQVSHRLVEPVGPQVVASYGGDVVGVDAPPV